jgi:hypothetical protein
MGDLYYYYKWDTEEEHNFFSPGMEGVSQFHNEHTAKKTVGKIKNSYMFTRFHNCEVHKIEIVEVMY